MTSAEFTKPSRKQRVRTLWISDVHLGTRDCQAEHLSQFLKGYHADKVYLVGDIIDGWKMRGGMYWPQAHTNVIRRLLTMAKRGTEVIYVTGNHDEFLRRYSKLILGNIQLVDEAVHVTADGRHLLVIHGDQFDVITRYHRWLAFLGDSAYEFTLTLNRWLNHWRARYGYGYWSLSAYLKHKVKTAVSFISDFEEAIAHEVTKRELHGVVCGHIHHAEIRKVGEVDYLNCGDWVESCTALIEHWDGSIQLYRLADAQAKEAQLQAEMVAGLRSTQSKGRRGLAPDSSESVSTAVAERPLSGASPLPHLVPVYSVGDVGDGLGQQGQARGINTRHVSPP